MPQVQASFMSREGRRSGARGGIQERGRNLQISLFLVSPLTSPDLSLVLRFLYTADKQYLLLQASPLLQESLLMTRGWFCKIFKPRAELVYLYEYIYTNIQSISVSLARANSLSQRQRASILLCHKNRLLFFKICVPVFWFRSLMRIPR